MQHFRFITGSPDFYKKAILWEESILTEEIRKTEGIYMLSGSTQTWPTLHYSIILTRNRVFGVLLNTRDVMNYEVLSISDWHNILPSGKIPDFKGKNIKKYILPPGTGGSTTGETLWEVHISCRTSENENAIHGAVFSIAMNNTILHILAQ